MTTKMLLIQEVENNQVKTVYFGPSQTGTITAHNDAVKRSLAMKRAWKTRKAKETKTK